ncbi:hypothetical protein E3E12_04295 [Formicincola oecophyllae]|uniref:Uncharacterized protein n=1 Tax=Formicincola oecophyllae TaxID=2558361 RepID=A0A4Y6U7Y4_9PROT|nr:hypothetical protein [Formicincola oecophyllae]QDH13543.1 hypothetical protein E3E12_04295 [Formicincola oecophyllae]
MAAFGGPFTTKARMGCAVGALLWLAGCQATTPALQVQQAQLAVPAPWHAPSKAAGLAWEKDMVAALEAQSLPASAHQPGTHDWWLRLDATKDPKSPAGAMKPQWTLIGPTGEVLGEGTAPDIAADTWRAATPNTQQALKEAAAYMAPAVADRLTALQTTRMVDDPHSLMHRAARIWFAGVEGAPGKGDKALANSFRKSFNDKQNKLQSDPEDADYMLHAKVTLAPLASKAGRPAQDQVIVQWHVQTISGQEAGAATEIHDEPAEALKGTWAGLAPVFTSEAVGAVKTIISNYSGRDRTRPAVPVHITQHDEPAPAQTVERPALEATAPVPPPEETQNKVPAPAAAVVAPPQTIAATPAPVEAPRAETPLPVSAPVQTPVEAPQATPPSSASLQASEPQTVLRAAETIPAQPTPSPQWQPVGHSVGHPSVPETAREEVEEDIHERDNQNVTLNVSQQSVSQSLRPAPPVVQAQSSQPSQPRFQTVTQSVAVPNPAPVRAEPLPLPTPPQVMPQPVAPQAPAAVTVQPTQSQAALAAQPVQPPTPSEEEPSAENPLPEVAPSPRPPVRRAAVAPAPPVRVTTPPVASLGALSEDWDH